MPVPVGGAQCFLFVMHGPPVRRSTPPHSTRQRMSDVQEISPAADPAGVLSSEASAASDAAGAGEGMASAGSSASAPNPPFADASALADPVARARAIAAALLAGTKRPREDFESEQPVPADKPRRRVYLPAPGLAGSWTALFRVS